MSIKKNPASLYKINKKKNGTIYEAHDIKNKSKIVAIKNMGKSGPTEEDISELKQVLDRGSKINLLESYTHQGSQFVIMGCYSSRDFAN